MSCVFDSAAQTGPAAAGSNASSYVVFRHGSDGPAQIQLAPPSRLRAKPMSV